MSSDRRRAGIGVSEAVGARAAADQASTCESRGNDSFAKRPLVLSWELTGWVARSVSP